jgi:hypothetical protein
MGCVIPIQAEETLILTISAQEFHLIENFDLFQSFGWIRGLKKETMINA